MILCRTSIILAATTLACLTFISTINARESSEDINDPNRSKNDNNGTQGAVAAAAAALPSIVHYLLPDATYKRLEQTNDEPLLELLERVGPDMKPASGFTDPANIDLNLARRAWTSMHEHAQQVARERVTAMWPSVERTLIEAKVTRECLDAARVTSMAVRRLETWAIKMLNSWGSFPPVGVFEGTLGDIGSFHGCLGVNPSNGTILHAHYCTFSYRPVLPTRPDYELVISSEPRELLGQFASQDVMSELAKKSQYNHYVYLKFGTCLPIECSPLDAQRLARLMGRRGILMSGPVKCHSKREEDYEQEIVQAADGRHRKLELSTRDLNRGVYIWKPHVTKSQLVALICLGALTCLIVGFTLADLALNRIPRLMSDLRIIEEEEDDDDNDEEEEKDEEEEQLRLEPRTIMNVHVIGTPPPCDFQTKTKDKPAQIDFDLNNNNDDDDEEEEEDGGEKKMDNAKVRVLHATNGTVSNQLASGSGHGAATRNKITRQQDARRTAGVGLLAEFVNDFSLITNTREFFTVGKQQLSGGDILCMNGLRCITMSWIILAHTIQYNDWAAFARIYEVESQLDSLANQPLFNASYLVDTFFLMSGLLTSFSVFRCKTRGAPGGNGRGREWATGNTNGSAQPVRRHFREILDSFSWRVYLLGRYLRLTPQILLVSLLFILLPLVNTTSGPHWHSMTGEYSENCSNNWWVNLLHIQAFYKPDEMCNFVCWWISVDMLYHLLALAVILIVLRLGPASVVRLCSGLAMANGLVQAARHYQMALPPNMLSTIPQTGAMWSQMTLRYFWTPNAHLFPFVFGFALGFCLARHRANLARWFTRRRALIGWLLAIGLFGLVLFGTRPWIMGATRYTRLSSTSFALIAQIIWSLALAWTIVACQLGYGSFINSALSCKLFIVLGKASYLVYLSHFLILFAFFGSQNLLLEPTRIMIIYLILSNICLSMLFGCILCVTFEMPWLKVQRRIMRHVK